MRILLTRELMKVEMVFVGLKSEKERSIKSDNLAALLVTSRQWISKRSLLSTDFLSGIPI